ncbi:MAG: hypothetical protein PF447_09395 [Spirochaetaceae bacterium]|jgi:hypothetical protein|nr:hypothetical protein [Spirochaetaceae bacterium]
MIKLQLWGINYTHPASATNDEVTVIIYPDSSKYSSLEAWCGWMGTNFGLSVGENTIPY